jgi:hypothetical protein
MSDTQARGFLPGNLVFESTTLAGNPCEIQNRPHLGVQAHRPAHLETYPGRVFRSRLKRPLSATESESLTGFLLSKVGVVYDGRGAVLAGTTLLKRGFLLGWRAADRSSLYCAELVGQAIRDCIEGSPEWNPGRLTPGRLAVLAVRSGLYGEPKQITLRRET